MDVEPYRRPTPAAMLFTRLDGGRWCARAQRLIEAGFAQTVEGLTLPLRRCLSELDQQLFALAERAHRPDVQQDCLASRQRVLQGHTAVLDSFVAQLADAFNRLGEKTPVVDVPAGTGWQTLALVDPVEQEREMTITQLGARGEAKHSHVLHELGYRMAVMIAAAPLEGDALPLGPRTLIRAMHHASIELALPPAHHVLLLQLFDRHVLRSCGPLYSVINTGWREDGILPNLRSAPLARSAAARVNPVDPGANATPDQTPADAARMGPETSTGRPASIEVLESLRELLSQRRGGAAQEPGSMSTRGASTQELQTALGALQQHLIEVTDHASRELRSAQRLREELLNQLNSGKPAGSPRTELTGEQGDTVELVAMLFEQLVQQLHQNKDARAVMGGLQLPMLNMAVTDSSFFETREHPARKLLDTVAVAANDWLDGSDDEGSRALADKLGQLVTQANREPPSAGLYTTLLADIEHHLALLTRKAQAAERRHVEAANGRERLERARRQASDFMTTRFAQSQPHGLLRTLLERAWSDVLALTLLRHGPDSAAFATQQLITDQLLGREPVTDRERLTMQINAGLQQIGMHVDEAEQLAQRLVGNIAESVRATATVATVRETSDATPAAPASADSQPLPTKSPTQPTVAKTIGDLRWPTAQPPAPTAPIETHTEPHVKADAPVHAAVPSPPPASTPAGKTVEPLSTTQMAQRLKQHHRLGEQAHVGASTAALVGPASNEPVLGPQEARIHNRLRQLPFGTWFEFIDPASGERAQRKLAWFSLVTGNVLFVTRRGGRGESMSLMQLAQAIAAGRVREMPKHSDSMLDRAWQSLTRNLRQTSDPRQHARSEFRR